MIEALETTLSKYGLLIRGGLNAVDLTPDAIGFDAKALILVGNAGSDIWPIFKQTPEYLDAKEDPMDRWCQRIGDEIAKDFSAHAVYPSDGPPYYPFISWAKQCETVHSSKMGFSIHPEFGLWHAFRFALLFPTAINGFQQTHRTKNPCSSCENSPCLSHCPVNAYTADGFDSNACFDFLQTDSGIECKTKGCIARRACPEGTDYQYMPEHAEFHMAAFYNSRIIERTSARDHNDE